MKTLLRRRPLLVGTLAAVLVALAAAVVTAAVVDDGAEERPVEATIRLTPEDQEADTNPLVGRDSDGEPVPTAAFPRLDAGLASLADYEGQPLLVNFFSSTCVPCRKEMPALERVHQELGDQVAFLGLAVQDTQRSAQAFVDEYAVTYDIGRDPNENLFIAMGAVQLPSTFFVAADGTIAYRHTGALTDAKIRSLLRSKLGVS
jgi:cytochrome c biogenesis protein CcmG/thiol:disulfide interchange protein DsbE